MTHKNEKTQELVRVFAVFEERALEALRASRRIDDDEVPKGVGARFIATVGEQMFPAIRAQMELREAKKLMRKQAFDEGAAAKRELDEGLEAAEKRLDLNWKYGSEAKALELKNKKAHALRLRLENEIAAGIYEVVPEEIDSNDDDLLDADERFEAEKAETAEESELLVEDD